jgi:putative peptidoglycan lipid II flippase
VVGAVVGHIVLSRRLGRLGMGPVARTVLQIALASALGGAAAYLIVRLTASALGDGHAGAATGLVAGGIGGLLVLAVAVWLLRIEDFRRLVASYRTRR